MFCQYFLPDSKTLPEQSAALQSNRAPQQQAAKPTQPSVEYPPSSIEAHYKRLAEVQQRKKALGRESEAPPKNDTEPAVELDVDVVKLGTEVNDNLRVQKQLNEQRTVASSLMKWVDVHAVGLSSLLFFSLMIYVCWLSLDIILHR